MGPPAAAGVDAGASGPVEPAPPIVDWMSLKHFIQPGAEVIRESPTRLEVYHPALDLSILVASEWAPDADIYRLPDPHASARWVWAATPRLLNDPARPREMWGQFFRAPFLHLVRLERPDPLTTDLTTHAPLEVSPPDTAPVTLETDGAATDRDPAPTEAQAPAPRQAEAVRAERIAQPDALPESTPAVLAPSTGAADAPGLGPLLGLSSGPEQVRVGGRLNAVNVGDHGLLGVALEVGSGGGSTSAFASLEGAVHIGRLGYGWRPYVGLGAGPTLTGEADGSRSSRIQLRVRGGVARRLPNQRGAVFLELSTAANGPDVILSAGWALSLPSAN